VQKKPSLKYVVVALSSGPIITLQLQVISSSSVSQVSSCYWKSLSIQRQKATEWWSHITTDGKSLCSHLCLPLCKWHLPLRVVSHLSHACYMSHPLHLPFDDTNNVWWIVQIVKLLVTQFSPASLLFLWILSAPNSIEYVEYTPLQVSVASSGSKQNGAKYHWKHWPVSQEMNVKCWKIVNRRSSNEGSTMHTRKGASVSCRAQLSLWVGCIIWATYLQCWGPWRQVHSWRWEFELNILPAFPHAKSDVIRLLQQRLLSRTINKGSRLYRPWQNYSYTRWFV
jgi:hypothetical protein